MNAEAEDGMGDSLRIALAQFDFPVGAVERNAERIAELIVDARDEYLSLIHI